MVTVGERKREMTLEGDTSDKVVRFSFLIWVLVTQLSLVDESLLSDILLIYAYFCVYTKFQ